MKINISEFLVSLLLVLFVWQEFQLHLVLENLKFGIFVDQNCIVGSGKTGNDCICEGNPMGGFEVGRSQ